VFISIVFIGSGMIRLDNRFRTSRQNRLANIACLDTSLQRQRCRVTVTNKSNSEGLACVLTSSI